MTNMGAQKDRRATLAWPRPKRSDAILLLVLCAFGVAAKVVMSSLDALTEGLSVRTDATSDEVSDGTHFVKSSNDWWQITILIHTSRMTWDTQAAAVKATWLAKPLPLGVRYFWVSEAPLPGEPAILVSDRLRPGLPEEPEGANNERVVQSLVQVLKKGRSLWYIKVNDDTYLNLAAITSHSLASLQSPQERPYYLGDCACSWEDGISWCSELRVATVWIVQVLEAGQQVAVLLRVSRAQERFLAAGPASGLKLHLVLEAGTLQASGAIFGPEGAATMAQASGRLFDPEGKALKRLSGLDETAELLGAASMLQEVLWVLSPVVEEV